LQDIYEQCRGRWNYLIPADHEEREILRSICERTLGFERHFLHLYKEFLLSELQHSDERGLLFALWALKQNIYRDEEILEAVSMLKNDARSVIQDAACTVLANYAIQKDV